MQDEDDWKVVHGSVRATVPLAISDESIRSKIAADQCDLYTPTGDIEDEMWIRKHRGEGDGVLSCPGCFTPVAYQFQRHERFEGQYRCKDVWSCEFGAEVETAAGDHFLKVVCSVCRADLGLWELSTAHYHLFHVLPGYG